MSYLSPCPPWGRRPSVLDDYEGDLGPMPTWESDREYQELTRIPNYHHVRFKPEVGAHNRVSYGPQRHVTFDDRLASIYRDPITWDLGIPRPDVPGGRGSVYARHAAPVWEAPQCLEQPSPYGPYLPPPSETPGLTTFPEISLPERRRCAVPARQKRLNYKQIGDIAKRMRGHSGCLRDSAAGYRGAGTRAMMRAGAWVPKGYRGRSSLVTSSDVHRKLDHFGMKCIPESEGYDVQAMVQHVNQLARPRSPTIPSERQIGYPHWLERQRNRLSEIEATDREAGQTRIGTLIPRLDGPEPVHYFDPMAQPNWSQRPYRCAPAPPSLPPARQGIPEMGFRAQPGDLIALEEICPSPPRRFLAPPMPSSPVSPDLRAHEHSPYCLEKDPYYRDIFEPPVPPPVNECRAPYELSGVDLLLSFGSPGSPGRMC